MSTPCARSTARLTTSVTSRPRGFAGRISSACYVTGKALYEEQEQRRPPLSWRSSALQTGMSFQSSISAWRSRALGLTST